MVNAMATFYKVMSNIPKMGQLPTPVHGCSRILKIDVFNDVFKDLFQDFSMMFKDSSRSFHVFFMDVRGFFDCSMMFHD